VVIDFRPEFDFAVIHDPCPNDWIDLFLPHRSLKPMTEVVPSANLDADCFIRRSAGLALAFVVRATQSSPVSQLSEP